MGAGEPGTVGSSELFVRRAMVALVSGREVSGWTLRPRGAGVHQTAPGP